VIRKDALTRDHCKDALTRDRATHICAFQYTICGNRMNTNWIIY